MVDGGWLIGREEEEVMRRRRAWMSARSLYAFWSWFRARLSSASRKVMRARASGRVILSAA